MREDPDVILVGELRDLETMSIAVTAAEMGILVMGTLHTNGAAQTVDRMVNVFPSDKQSHVRTMLSTSLRGVVSQQLLQRFDKQGRVAALEILVNTTPPPTSSARASSTSSRTSCRRAAQFGMRTMDTAIQQLLDSRQVTGKEAYKKAINKAKSRHQGRRLTPPGGWILRPAGGRRALELSKIARLQRGLTFGPRCGYCVHGLANPHHHRPADLPRQGLYQGHRYHGLRGTRHLADGQSAQQIIHLYPTLRLEHVAAAVAYAAELARERVIPTAA